MPSAILLDIKSSQRDEVVLLLAHFRVRMMMLRDLWLVMCEFVTWFKVAPDLEGGKSRNPSEL